MPNEIMIIIKFRFEGVHRWRDCNFDDVSYLSHFHRHMFHVTCWKRVYNANRELEFIKFKRTVEAFAKDKYTRSDESCEMMAQGLLEMFHFAAVEVLEDGENGAVVRRA